jgi:hypothetical protein
MNYLMGYNGLASLLRPINGELFIPRMYLLHHLQPEPSARKCLFFVYLSRISKFMNEQSRSISLF